MKKSSRFVSFLLAAVLLLGAVPAYAAGVIGLNGAGGNAKNFDYSKYDATVDFTYMVGSSVRGTTVTYYAEEDFEWPDGQVILVKVTGSAWTKDALNYISVPDGRTVDVYKFDLSVYDGSGTYTLWAHYGASAGTSNTGSTSNTSSGTAASGTPAVTTPGTPVVYTHSYSDVNPGDWYYDAIMTMTEGGLLAGYPDGSFGPNDPVTSGQFSLILCRLAKSPNTEYWEKAVSLPSNQVPMTRGRTTRALVGNLRTVDTATKKYYWHALTDAEYELAVKTHAYVTPRVDKDNTVKYVMYKREYEFWKNSLNTGINYHASLDEFPDGDAIWQYCCDDPVPIDATVEEQRAERAEDILQAWNYGIFRGDTNGDFNAAGILTRAQLCQVLYNMGWTKAGDLY